MNWTKVEHNTLEVCFEGRLETHPETFWLFKDGGQWKVSCSALDIAGSIVTQGATDDAEAQRLAVRFFMRFSLDKAVSFLSLGQSLGAL